MTTQIHRISDLKRDLRSIKDAANESAAGSPPAGYDDLEGDALKVADECYRNGLDAMETAILNWIYDQEKAQDQPATSPTEQATEGERDFGSNGGVKCDTDNGPCACGAWHDKKAVHALQWSDILDEVGALHCDENFDGNWKNGYEHFRADVLGVIDRLRHAPADSASAQLAAMREERDEALAESKYRGEMVDSWRKSYEERLDEVYVLRTELAAAQSEVGRLTKDQENTQWLWGDAVKQLKAERTLRQTMETRHGEVVAQLATLRRERDEAVSNLSIASANSRRNGEAAEKFLADLTAANAELAQTTTELEKTQYDLRVEQDECRKFHAELVEARKDSAMLDWADQENNEWRTDLLEPGKSLRSELTKAYDAALNHKSP